MWFNILKEPQQISSTGIRTKLGSTPLTMGNEDDVDCCEIARGWIKGWVDVNVGKGHFETHIFDEGGTLEEMDCNRLYFWIKKWSEFFWRPNPADRNFAKNWAKDIIEKWDQCEDNPSNFTSDGIMTYHGNMSDTIVGE